MFMHPKLPSLRQLDIEHSTYCNNVSKIDIIPIGTCWTKEMTNTTHANLNNRFIYLSSYVVKIFMPLRAFKFLSFVDILI